MECLEIHAPTITFVDCEGAGDAFEVSQSEEFFGKQAYLTVSAQLHAEMAAASLSRCYSFGPTFRAEKHNSSRHLSEFWMLEAEVAFIKDVDQLAGLVEDMVRTVTQRLIEQSIVLDDLLIGKPSNVSGKMLEERWKQLSDKPFNRITYTEAVSKLKSENFTFPVKWGLSLQLEHEKFLSEQIFKGPVFVTDYPSHLKPFYMKLNEDEKTVANLDLLLPSISEVAGGSIREDRLAHLQQAITRFGLNGQEYKWYVDLRKFGSVPHGGFGLGFDRYLQYLMGINNIRDVVMVPRSTGSAEY